MKVVNKFLFFVHIMKIAEKEKLANLFYLFLFDLVKLSFAHKG